VAGFIITDHLAGPSFYLLHWMEGFVQLCWIQPNRPVSGPSSRDVTRSQSWLRKGRGNAARRAACGRLVTRSFLSAPLVLGNKN